MPPTLINNNLYNQLHELTLKASFGITFHFKCWYKAEGKVELSVEIQAVKGLDVFLSENATRNLGVGLKFKH